MRTHVVWGQSAHSKHFRWRWGQVEGVEGEEGWKEGEEVDEMTAGVLRIWGEVLGGGPALGLDESVLVRGADSLAGV